MVENSANAQIPTPDRQGQNGAKQSEGRHGGLAEALVQAGLELLREGGLQGLSLRKCAARAGVSHAAPAHHFGNLNGLISEIAARGHEMFKNAMVAERDRAEPNPRARLLAICRGYLAFARENEALYRLMFASENVAHPSPHLECAAADSFAVLAECCAEIRPTKPGDYSMEMAVWSVMHGYVELSRCAYNGQGGHPASMSELEDVLAWLRI